MPACVGSKIPTASRVADNVEVRMLMDTRSYSFVSCDNISCSFGDEPNRSGSSREPCWFAEPRVKITVNHPFGHLSVNHSVWTLDNA